MIRNGLGFALSTIALSAGSAVGQCLVMGGFDQARGGLLSLSQGGWLTQLREALFLEFPSAVELTATGELTATYLEGVDVLFLSSVREGSMPISPLTLAEQDAVQGFVRAGGNAIIFVDNDMFAGANASLLAPFNVGVSGTSPWAEPVTVPNPLGHPITSGRFGVIQSLGLLNNCAFRADGAEWTGCEEREGHK